MAQISRFLSFSLVTLCLTSAFAAAQVPSWKPFTALLQQQGRSADGSIAYSETLTYAVRTDGSFATAVERKFPDGKAYEIRTVRDIGAGKQLHIDGATRSVVDLDLRSPVRMTSCRASGNQHDVILGYDVYQVVRKWEWDGYLHTAESWVAPALNCFSLKTILYEPSQSGTSATYTTTTVQKISASEPDPALFRAPKGYVRRTVDEFTNVMKLHFPEMPFQATLPFAN